MTDFTQLCREVLRQMMLQSPRGVMEPAVYDQIRQHDSDLMNQAIAKLVAAKDAECEKAYQNGFNNREMMFKTLYKKLEEADERLAELTPNKGEQ